MTHLQKMKKDYEDGVQEIFTDVIIAGRTAFIHAFESGDPHLMALIYKTVGAHDLRMMSEDFGHLARCGEALLEDLKRRKKIQKNLKKKAVKK